MRPGSIFRLPVFVLAHHDRAPIEMKGGTAFHFVAGGFDAAPPRSVGAMPVVIRREG
jgi:hypothetical protein